LAIDVYKDWLGIPEGPRPPDHYQLMRLVEFEDSAEKIRTNYKKLNAHVRRYATGQYLEESQALLNELARAMLCLTDTERKREYDLGMGRIFDEEETGPRTMDVILLEQNHISAAQAQEAREHAERTGLELRDSFVQLKIVAPEIAAQALALELGLPYVDLADLHPDDEALDQVPKKTVKQNSILPLFIDEGKLLVACAHQLDHELEQELQMRFGVPARCVLATPRDISQAINKYYAPGMRNETAASTVADTTGNSKKGAEKKAAAREAPKPQRRGPRTPEEISERKKIGIVIFNFSFLLAYLLDTWVVTPGAYDLWTAGLYLVIPGITAFVVWQTYFKN
jgi:hypothetical protein